MVSPLLLLLLLLTWPGGHLLSYVMDSDDAWADEKAAFYGGEVLLSLEHMHNSNVVYRDLKLENILLDMDGHVRLTDFGLSALLKEKGDRVHSMSGSPLTHTKHIKHTTRTCLPLPSPPPPAVPSWTTQRCGGAELTAQERLRTLRPRC